MGGICVEVLAQCMLRRGGRGDGPRTRCGNDPPPKHPPDLSDQIKQLLRELSSCFGLLISSSGSRKYTTLENATHQTTRNFWMS